MDGIFQHYQTMSIASVGSATLPKATKRVFETKITNYIDDIDGAYKKNRNYNRTLPLIEPREPSNRQLYSTGYRPNYSLAIDDIEGARHRVKGKIAFTSRHVNPLEPEYDLPTYEIRTHTPPRFLRDNINHDDILGSSPKPLYAHKTRDTALNISDIEGTTSKVK